MTAQAQLVKDWNLAHEPGIEVELEEIFNNHKITTCSHAYLDEYFKAYVNIKIEEVCETKWLVSKLTPKSKKETTSKDFQSKFKPLNLILEIKTEEQLWDLYLRLGVSKEMVLKEADTPIPEHLNFKFEDNLELFNTLHKKIKKNEQKIKTNT